VSALGELHVLEPALRLAIAAALAAAMGWEREAAGKPAGLRTHMIVGVAAALYVALVDVEATRYESHARGMQIDPTRAIDAVATGIGFLGAGIIFVSRRTGAVQGLTTAASIWATAAVGVAVGLEAYVLAVAATLLLVGILRGLRRFEQPTEQAVPVPPTGGRHDTAADG
jgi:putative Mg2+ transporter-C (MgtC) family protein